MRYLRPLALVLLLASLVGGSLTPAVSAKASTYYAEVSYDAMVNNRFEVFVSILAVNPGQMWVEIDLVDWSIDPDSEDSDPSLIDTHASFSSTTFNLKVSGSLGHGTLTATLPLSSCTGAACDLLGQSLSVNLSFVGTGERSGDPSFHIQRYASVAGTISGASLDLLPTGVTGLLARDKQ